MTKVGRQAQAEYAAGYKHGLAGESEPKPDKGKSYWLGWNNGKADRQQDGKTEAR